MKAPVRTSSIIITVGFLILGGPYLAVSAEPGGSADTMHLTDEPGNWFRSEATGGPVTVVNVGDRVDFEIGQFTQTKHTVTLISKPPASDLEVDMDQAQRGSISAEFDRPGVHLFTCKVHPYMQGVVGVRTSGGTIPDVTAQQLPFIGHLGVSSLPASTVASVLTAVAPTDADKTEKWDIFGPAAEFEPAVPGIGEVWVNAQFERVPGQVDDHGVPKPGTIPVVDAATFEVEREIDGGLDPQAANGGWNNPHNMWANTRLSTIYNGNWFGQTINKIQRASGDVVQTLQVGEAPTHLVSNPNQASPQFGCLTLPLSADNDLLKIRDASGGLQIVDKDPTGVGHTHPHGQWLTADGSKVVVPNVFRGLGMAGSISIMNANTNAVIKEIPFQPSGLASALALPVASGIKGNSKAYVSNIGSGQVSVLDLATRSLVKNIPVTFTPDGRRGAEFDIFDTLQAPIQVPVSPDGRFAAVAVLSLTTVGRSPTGAADHVAIIDTKTDRPVAFLPTPAGTHGAHWGAKAGGGYYLYVTNQYSNALTVIDPDPNSDANAADAHVVGRILLSDGSPGSGPTDGTGGQGLKPLPNMYNGWIQDTVALAGTGQLSPEVESWIAALTPAQKNPS